MVRAKVSAKKPLPCIVFCRFLVPLSRFVDAPVGICSYVCCPVELFLQLSAGRNIVLGLAKSKLG